MNFVKRGIKVFLIFCFLFVNVISISLAEENVKVENDKVIINVERCNVQAVPSDEGTITYEYDSEKFEVRVVEEDEHKVIDIYRKSGAELEWDDRFIINIPKDQYEKLIFNVERGALSLDEMLCDIEVHVERGALSVKSPKGKENSLEINAERSAVGITLWDDENFNIEAEVERSTFAYPKGCKVNRDGDKIEYSKGEEECKVELRLERSSCSIK